MDNNLAGWAITELDSLSHRLYCVSQAAMHGDDWHKDHSTHIGEELNSIWHLVDGIVSTEKDRLSHIEEEMRKFQMGFAYKPKKIKED